MELPLGARILKAGVQKHKAFLWALVNINKQPNIKRMFIIASTGFDTIPANYRYIDSFIDDKVDFVGHVFEVLKK